MTRLIRKRSQKAGLMPGTLVHVGEKKMDKVKIQIIDYNEQQLEEKELKTFEECYPFKESSTITWMNVDGIHDVEIIEKLGTCFNLHPLIMEDILNTTQRPKYEDFDDYIFIVLRMLYYDEKDNEVKSEQVSLILGKNFVISFQEKEGDVFNQIRNRIRNSKGRIRKLGADYLVYALIDAVVDNYFTILEKFGEKSENMEEKLVSEPSSETLQIIQHLKREMISLRKSIWPLREVISNMQKQESSLIKKNTAIYLRDVHDHTIQVIDTIESLRDTTSGMLDIYLSSISNKMNEVMKVLTIIATIFIPLTFIAGIYGMNFNPQASSWNMPELNWKFGYLGIWGVMLMVFLVMVLYFKRKKWL